MDTRVCSNLLHGKVTFIETNLEKKVSEETSLKSFVTSSNPEGAATFQRKVDSVSLILCFTQMGPVLLKSGYFILHA